MPKLFFIMPNVDTTEPFFLKNIYSPELLDSVGDEFSRAFSSFDKTGFLIQVFDSGWVGRELNQRTRHISVCLQNQLPVDFTEAVCVIVGVANQLIEERGEAMVFEWGFLPDFVEAFGRNFPIESLDALEHITRWTSAEFAVRPFLLHHPDLSYPYMNRWSCHSSEYVRRLSSEGFRPRLPWGMGISALKVNPSPILPILQQLKGDPSETVRRSVANNLNDMSKDHPMLVLNIAESWIGKSLEIDRVVRHACRGLLKKGDTRALALFGFVSEQSTIMVEELQCSETLYIGDVLNFSFLVKNTSNESTLVRIEYAIDYLTSTGKRGDKVFKIAEINVSGGESVAYTRKQRFQDFTTRKHFAGKHTLEIRVNGVKSASRDFQLFAP